jgi:hypothetical protein
MFNEFSKLLRDHAPVDYSINPMGESVREELEKQIVYIEGMAETLRDLLPKAPKEEDESAAHLDEYLEDSGDQVQDLNYFLEKVSKPKRTAGDAPKGVTKRIKHEHD